MEPEAFHGITVSPNLHGLITLQIGNTTIKQANCASKTVLLYPRLRYVYQVVASGNWQEGANAFRQHCGEKQRSPRYAVAPRVNTGLVSPLQS